MKNNSFKLAMMAFLIVPALCIKASAQNPSLDEYIRQGLQSNTTLEQQKLEYLKSVSQVREAKGLFLPGLSLNARYTVANGGRTISFPLNDIFTGYSALNNFANPGLNLVTPPQFRNEEIYFLRRTEQETKVSLVQPLFNTDIWYNTRIRQEISSATEKQYKASARTLIYNIRNAYFSYMKAAELHNWLMEAKALSTEFVRVNESLLANDKVTADAVYRARAEDSRVDQEIAEAERLKAVSMGYFNYLTGRPADDPVTVDDSVTVTPPFGTVDDVIASAMAGREELVQLDLLQDAAAYGVKLYSAGRLPTLAAAADYGFQGEQYRFTGRDDYMLASLVLRWDLFEGFRKKQQLTQAMLDMRNVEAGREDALKKIGIEARDAWYGFLSAGTAMQTSALEEQAMHKAFLIIKSKYENGQSGMLEYNDAKTRWSQSVMNMITKKYDYYISYFNLLKVSACEDITNFIITAQ